VGPGGRLNARLRWGALGRLRPLWCLRGSRRRDDRPLVLRAIRRTPKSTRQAVLAGRGGRLKRPERQNVGRCRRRHRSRLADRWTDRAPRVSRL